MLASFVVATALSCLPSLIQSHIQPLAAPRASVRAAVLDTQSAHVRAPAALTAATLQRTPKYGMYEAVNTAGKWHARSAHERRALREKQNEAVSTSAVVVPTTPAPVKVKSAVASADKGMEPGLSAALASAPVSEALAAVRHFLTKDERLPASTRNAAVFLPPPRPAAAVLEQPRPAPVTPEEPLALAATTSQRPSYIPSHPKFRPSISSYGMYESSATRALQEDYFARSASERQMLRLKRAQAREADA